MCTHFVAVYGVLMRIFFQLRYAKKKSFPSNAWLCSCSRKITRNDYQTLSSLYINETMKQCWSLSSQCVIVSQINYLPQPLASQISVPSDQIYWCCAYSLLTSDKIHQSLCSKTPTNVDTPLCVVMRFWRTHIGVIFLLMIHRGLSSVFVITTMQSDCTANRLPVTDKSV